MAIRKERKLPTIKFKKIQYIYILLYKGQGLVCVQKKRKFEMEIGFVFVINLLTFLNKKEKNWNVFVEKSKSVRI